MVAESYHRALLLLAVASMSTAVALDDVSGNPSRHFEAKLSPTSSCQGAISHYGTEGLPPVVLRPGNTEYKSSLIFYGAGQLATGSHLLHELLCSFNISSIHTSSSCHIDEATMMKHNSLVESWRCLVHRSCPFYFREGERRKESLRIRIREQMWDLLLHGNAQALMDIPYHNLAEQVFAAVPDAYVFLTVQEPNDWVRLRASSEHSRLCRDGHHHPLDLYACAGDKYGALKTFKSLSAEQLAAVAYDYAEFNARIRDMAKPGRVLEVCMVDNGVEGIKQALRMMGFSELAS